MDVEELEAEELTVVIRFQAVTSNATDGQGPPTAPPVRLRDLGHSPVEFVHPPRGAIEGVMDVMDGELIIGVLRFTVTDRRELRIKYVQAAEGYSLMGFSAWEVKE